MYFCAPENELILNMKIIIKKLPHKKALLILFLFTACLVLPVGAQKSDDFFRNDMLYNDRNGTFGGYNVGTQVFGSDVSGGYNITTQQFGQEAPLDGCLLIMLGAGAVYAARKRKRG